MTAGHCTFAVGMDGESTTSEDGAPLENAYRHGWRPDTEHAGRRHGGM